MNGPGGSSGARVLTGDPSAASGPVTLSGTPGQGAGTPSQQWSLVVLPLDADSVWSLRPRTYPSMSLTAAASTVTLPSQVTLTATMPGDAVCSLGFYDVSTPGTAQGLGTATLTNGKATLSVTLTAGTHQLQASFPGDATYRANDSNTVTVVVNPVPFTLQLSADATTLTTAQSPTFTVTSTPGEGAQVLVIEVDASGNYLGLVGSTPVSSGTATVTSSRTYAVGTHYFVANRYQSDVASNTVTITVTAPSPGVGAPSPGSGGSGAPAGAGGAAGSGGAGGAAGSAASGSTGASASGADLVTARSLGGGPSVAAFGNRGALASTGMPVEGLLALAAVLVALGLALTYVRRRVRLR